MYYKKNNNAYPARKNYRKLSGQLAIDLLLLSFFLKIELEGHSEK